MPTAYTSGGPLAGQALADASHPIAQTPRGGLESGFTGESGQSETPKEDAAPRQPDLGSWLTEDDETVFETAHNLVLRQELLAINHHEVDKHYTRFKLGYPFSVLEKNESKSTYRAELPAGTKALTVQAVPNMAWDLVNKATETVLADFPQPDPSPVDDSEKAHAAAEMANRFLTENSGENGTNDTRVLYEALDKALTCATSFIEVWTDPVGGGYEPLQILAHPLAADPANPLVGPDGMPTTDPVLRYVTKPEGGQFTTQPAQAAPQWIPKLRAVVWGREHWRLYPESATVETADKAIGLLYCTIGEAKKRWPKVAEMGQGELNALLGWTPVRFLVLLPPYQRARWKISIGSDTEQSGSADERIIFFYRVLQKAAPDHPHGAEVIVSGALGGLILDKKVLAATLEVPGEDGEGPVQDVRCMDIPLIQLTPRRDPDERDPQGRPYIELFCGAVEFNATLATGFLQALNQWLNPDSYVVSTSSVQGFQVEDSRASGDAIPLLKLDDKPSYGNMPPIPPNFWEAWDRNDGAIRSIASLEKPVTGSDHSAEVSGKARQIAVNQGMVGLSRMQHPVNGAGERLWRVYLQTVMRDFTAPQTIRYVGEDGAWREEQWKATDFALVGSVGIQAGTGTMMPPDQKVQYLANLKAEGLMPVDDAADAARATYAERLGLPDNPHEQYIERCLATWLKGPPGGAQGPWVQQWTQYQQALAQYTQAKAAWDQQQAAAQQQQAAAAQQAMLPPAPDPVAEHQRALEMETHKAGIAQQAAEADHRRKLDAEQQAHARKLQATAQAADTERQAEAAHRTQLAAESDQGRARDAQSIAEVLAAHKPEPPVIHIPPAQAPVINLPAPVVHVHVPEHPAPVIHVPKGEAPVVHTHVEAARAPIIHHEAPAKRGKRKMKGTLGGKPFEVAVEDAEGE